MVDVDVDAIDILSASSWKNTTTFQSIQNKETQKKYYARMNSSPEVQTLVEMDSKLFGSVIEKMICELLKLGPRASSQNDGTRLGKKIEIKAARYWISGSGGGGGGGDCCWQHLEPDHDYEYALLALLDFHCLQLWAISKSRLMGEMREKKIVTCQGKQGWWVKKSDILPYLTPIHSVAEFDAFITGDDSSSSLSSL